MIFLVFLVHLAGNEVKDFAGGLRVGEDLNHFASSLYFFDEALQYVCRVDKVSQFLCRKDR